MEMEPEAELEHAFFIANVNSCISKWMVCETDGRWFRSLFGKS